MGGIKSLFPVKLNLKCISCGMLYKMYLLALDNKLLENLLSINNFRYSHFIQQTLICHASMLSMLVIPRQCHGLFITLCLLLYSCQFRSPGGYPSATRKLCLSTYIRIQCIIFFNVHKIYHF